MNNLKSQINKELTLEMSNESIGTTNRNSLSLLKEHINSLESEIYFLRDKLRVKADLIKSLFHQNQLKIQLQYIHQTPSILKLH